MTDTYSGVPSSTPAYTLADFSLGAIAAAVGVSKDTVARDLRAAGTPSATRVRGRDGKTYPASKEGQRHTAALALTLHRQGWTQARIATRLGVSQPTVSRLLRDWTTRPDS